MDQDTERKPRLGFYARRRIGLTGLVVFVLVYVAVAMEFGARVIVPMHGVVQFVYYVVVGFVWVIPAMAIIKWIRKVPNPNPPQDIRV